MIFFRFFVFALTYMIAAIGFAYMARGTDAVAALASLWPGSAQGVGIDPWLLLALVVMAVALYFAAGRLKPLALDMHLAILGTGVFLAAFSLFKSAMPLVVPFHADPFLADLDRALHFGTDPWELTHMLAPWINPQAAAIFYVTVWTVFSSAFPLFLALSDRDVVRRAHYLQLFFLVWIVLGNVFALVFMSAGPVFYDRLFAEPAFAGLLEALRTSGVDASGVGSVRDFLWTNYAANSTTLGSGISAFPSVHVGMATLIALYVAERWRPAAPLAALYLLAVLFLSVYLGWHYAVDGYFSILVVLGAVWLLRRKGSRAAQTVRA